MKIFYTFISLVFAIYVGVRGVEFMQRGNNAMILLGVACIFFGLGLSYITVKLALKNK